MVIEALKAQRRAGAEHAKLPHCSILIALPVRSEDAQSVISGLQQHVVRQPRRTLDGARSIQWEGLCTMRDALRDKHQYDMRYGGYLVH